MANRCLNKVMLIGNLTRDPELRYTPNGVAVCSFGLATNRRWTTQDGQTKEDAQFHRIVAWNRLAELCAQLLKKGVRVFVEGRLQYREWTGADNVKRQVAEVVIEDMIILDNRQAATTATSEPQAAAVEPTAEPPAAEETAVGEADASGVTDDQGLTDDHQSTDDQDQVNQEADESEKLAAKGKWE